MQNQDQIMDAARPLTRRSVARFGATGLLSMGVDALTLAQVSAGKPSQGTIRVDTATTIPRVMTDDHGRRRGRRGRHGRHHGRNHR